MRGADGRIVVVGATGLVGETLLAVLGERGLATRAVAVVPGDAGPALRCGAIELRPVALDGFAFAPTDVVLLAVDATLAARAAAKALAAGARVVDNSTAFRADAGVPLVIPEVNAGVLGGVPPPRLIASPNCSTTMLLVALEPLRAAFGLAHVAVTTYQAISGAGRAAVEELRRQTAAALRGEPISAEVLPLPCAFNVFPHESALDPASGLCGEEQKIVAEARRIWRLPSLPIDPCCVRVPVQRAHCQAVVATLLAPATLTAVRAALAAAPGVHLLDDVDPAGPPTALRASGGDAVLVGRVRWAASELDRPAAERRRVSLWLAADQLRKGAALNTVQIAAAAGWLADRCG